MCQGLRWAGEASTSSVPFFETPTPWICLAGWGGARVAGKAHRALPVQGHRQWQNACDVGNGAGWHKLMRQVWSAAGKVHNPPKNFTDARKLVWSALNKARKSKAKLTTPPANNRQLPNTLTDRCDLVWSAIS